MGYARGCSWWGSNLCQRTRRGWDIIIYSGSAYRWSRINEVSLCDMKWSCGSWNFPLMRKVKQNSFLILRRHISYLRSKSHPAESRQITSSLFTVTSYFKKILIKGKRQVKSEEVISKKSSFLRMRIFWRREWDSNPRDVAVKRFSSFIPRLLPAVC